MSETVTNAVETTENVVESAQTNTVANIVVLSFAIIGAVNTTKFVVTKVGAGVRALKAIKAEQNETVAHATTPTE